MASMNILWHEPKRQSNLKKHDLDFSDDEIRVISMRKAENHEIEQLFSYL